MKIFDPDIIKLKEELNNLNFRTLYRAGDPDCIQNGNTDPLPVWPVKEQPVLRSDMAYELGGSDSWAVGGLAFTSGDSSIAEDFSTGVYLAGPDLGEIDRDISYARFTLIKLSESDDEQPRSADSPQGTENAGHEVGAAGTENAGHEVGAHGTEAARNNAVYRVMRRTDYVKYHIQPEGYLLRISSVREREPVRVSREALARGLSFEKVGRLFLQEYLKIPEVAGAQVFFITAGNADYGRLQEFAHRFEQITDSLQSIFNGLKMDCGTCGMKAVCDEVEGLRELHFGFKEGKTDGGAW